MAGIGVMVLGWGIGGRLHAMSRVACVVLGVRVMEKARCTARLHTVDVQPIVSWRGTSNIFPEAYVYLHLLRTLKVGRNDL